MTPSSSSMSDRRDGRGRGRRRRRDRGLAKQVVLSGQGPVRVNWAARASREAQGGEARRSYHLELSRHRGPAPQQTRHRPVDRVLDGPTIGQATLRHGLQWVEQRTLVGALSRPSQPTGGLSHRLRLGGRFTSMRSPPDVHRVRNQRPEQQPRATRASLRLRRRHGRFDRECRALHLCMTQWDPACASHGDRLRHRAARVLRPARESARQRARARAAATRSTPCLGEIFTPTSTTRWQPPSARRRARQRAGDTRGGA